MDPSRVLASTLLTPPFSWAVSRFLVGWQMWTNLNPNSSVASHRACFYIYALQGATLSTQMLTSPRFTTVELRWVAFAVFVRPSFLLASDPLDQPYRLHDHQHSPFSRLHCQALRGMALLGFCFVSLWWYFRAQPLTTLTVRATSKRPTKPFHCVTRLSPREMHAYIITNELMESELVTLSA